MTHNHDASGQAEDLPRPKISAFWKECFVALLPMVQRATSTLEATKLAAETAALTDQLVDHVESMERERRAEPPVMRSPVIRPTPAALGSVGVYKPR